MKKIIVYAGTALLLTFTVHAESLFRWVDSEGKVHYGDRPASDAVKVETKKFTAPTVSDDDALPYATRQAKQNFPVTLYVSENCGTECVQARTFLNKRGIPFVEKLLVTNEENQAFIKESGADVIPTLAVGKTFLKGFEAVQWTNELDIAGYPKTAPYGARAVPPAQRPPQAVSEVAPAIPAQ
jgi:glutaredoxin